MIKLNELRIGNLVYEAGEPSRIYQLGSGGISFFTINDINVNKETGRTLQGHEKRFEPIALTPEWLGRMGFNTRPEERFYIFHNERVLFEYWLLDGSIVIQGGFVGYKIRYVHQLQNLYFALTGEELTIKS